MTAPSSSSTVSAQKSAQTCCGHICLPCWNPPFPINYSPPDEKHQGGNHGCDTKRHDMNNTPNNTTNNTDTNNNTNNNTNSKSHTSNSSPSVVSAATPFRSGLFVNNSMCGNSKVEFVTTKGGRQVTWYGCGPTVYDHAHMGHARTYVCFDIIRRIMQNYFGYDIYMVMNVTDIDDKIIARAAEQGKDFKELARHWESEFFEDMTKLNVMMPDVLTRVSEYVDEIVAYIVQIVDNGYAYESNGSVYFDTQSFRGSDKHFYGRMEPNAVNDETRVLDGEGALGVAVGVGDKRHRCDFALWKNAKPDEPSWQSPWGQGRPGWHIECSAMASSILPFPLDIHSGGIDLRFPHHTNELAQSEAYYNQPQWVNYFLHTGHLNIQGCKMSKSLKNFVTIEQVLEKFSPRHVRILCLINRWDSPMNYSSSGETIQQAADVDRSFFNFFSLVRSITKTSAVGGGVTQHQQRWTPKEHTLHAQLLQAQTKVRETLSDNFNTPDAVVELQHLMSDANSYINNTIAAELRSLLVLKIATYIFHILKVFGLTNESETTLRYGQDESAVEGGGKEEAVGPIMEVFGSFRNEVRAEAKNLLKECKAAGVSASAPRIVDGCKQLLSACDAVRDNKLPAVGVQIEDRPEGFIWKLAQPTPATNKSA
eukprot:GHVS01056046.1.p1 GENE.GHVS01056046.1~~GHVS01056046.1.p1  ORF type:complete len:700 (+),score=106.70 GHVS01056046.1:152-2101(+)